MLGMSKSIVLTDTGKKEGSIKSNIGNHASIGVSDMSISSSKQ